MIRESLVGKLLCLTKTTFIVLLFTCSLSACAQETTHSITYSNSRVIDIKGMEKDILYYINQYRASVGLPVLQTISSASDQATKHSIDMADRVTPFGHDGFDDRIDNIVKKIGF